MCNSPVTEETSDIERARELIKRAHEEWEFYGDASINRDEIIASEVATALLHARADGALAMREKLRKRIATTD